MNDVQTLLARCRELGAELTPTAHGTLKVKAPAPLPEELRQALKQRKAEVMSLVEAMTWLQARLTVPHRLAPLLAEWLGTLDKPTGRSLDMLMGARWALGADVYVGDDGRFWWRLPKGTIQ